MVNINGEDWKILIVSSNHPSLQRPNGSFTLGCCDDNVKTIYIVEGLNDFYFKKVMCHELVHAAMFAYDVMLEHDEEELLAEIIATFGEEIIDLTDIMFEKIRRGRY